MCRLKTCVRSRLRAAALLEAIVAGIVFLSVMDGLTLFSRLQTRRMATILENRRFVEGYCCL